MTTAFRHNVAGEASLQSDYLARGLAVLRIVFGLTFLWAFFDKLLALGFGTGAVTDEAGRRTSIDVLADGQAWLNGGSPTDGFLSNVSPDNWLHGMWTSMAGDAWADWLFMAGLLGVGLALTLGVGMRAAAVAGGLLYGLMWLASFPLPNNPVIDDHLVGLITLVVLAIANAGDTWGLGSTWVRTSLVRQHAYLR